MFDLFLASEVTEVVAPLVLSDEKGEARFTNTADSTEERLEPTPVAIDGLGMDIATHILTRVMIYPSVEVAIAPQSSVAFEAVGVD